MKLFQALRHTQQQAEFATNTSAKGQHWFPEIIFIAGANCLDDIGFFLWFRFLFLWFILRLERLFVFLRASRCLDIAQKGKLGRRREGRLGLLDAIAAFGSGWRFGAGNAGTCRKDGASAASRKVVFVPVVGDGFAGGNPNFPSVRFGVVNEFCNRRCSGWTGQTAVEANRHHFGLTGTALQNQIAVEKER